jgi:uncharacterized protein YraI
MIKKLVTALAVAISSLILATAAAQAQSAIATSSVNVRNAPVNGAVVDVLSPGQEVEIDRCSGGWCYVLKSGPDGWVSANYLSIADAGPRVVVPDRPSPSRPDVSIGFSVPGFSFQIGSGGFDIRPGRPIRERDRACFFERSNFRGDSFCARPGERLARLGRWDRNISSIQIQGDAEVLICERTNFDGRCIVISRSTRDLGRADDSIRSLRVR